MTATLTWEDARLTLAGGRLLRLRDEAGERISWAQGRVSELSIAALAAAADCDRTEPSSDAGDYFVDPSYPGASDGHPGTSPVKPWRTLQPVRQLLSTAAYQGGVRIWLASGATFSPSSEAVNSASGLGWDPAVDGDLLVVRAWGSEQHPVRIGSFLQLGLPWSVARTEVGDATSGSGATLDGEDPFFEQVDSAESFVGLYLEDVCHVEVHGLRVTGFDHGVVLRACSDCLVSGCKVDENFTRGVAITVNTSDEPSRHITVAACHLHDNGWDTSGYNLGLGAGSADCLIQDNEIYCSTSVRGVDGVLLDGASSGHIIEGNRIYGHISNLDDGSDGDGIDLKGVRQRDPDDGELTLIRDNEIFDNQNDGIILHNFCEGVHIFRNRIWRNGKGIQLTPGSLESTDDIETISNPYHSSGTSARGSTVQAAVQGDISIYRNIIGRSLESGIVLDLKKGETGSTDYEVILFRRVLIVNNTIDYNANHGISVARALTRDDEALDGEQNWLLGQDASRPPETFTIDALARWFESIGIYNNILSRNGVRKERSGDAFGYMQIRLGSLIESTYHGQSDFGELYVDYNVYVESRQQAADVTKTGDVVGVRYWWWDPGGAVFEVDNVKLALSHTLLAPMGFTAGSQTTDLSEVGYVDDLPRAPDHRLDGLGIAVTSTASWSATTLPADLLAVDAEHGIFVPWAPDMDGVSALMLARTPDIGALNA